MDPSNWRTFPSSTASPRAADAKLDMRFEPNGPRLRFLTPGGEEIAAATLPPDQARAFARRIFEQYPEALPVVVEPERSRWDALEWEETAR